MAVRRKRTDLSLGLKVDIFQLVQEKKLSNKKSPPDLAVLSQQFPRL